MLVMQMNASRFPSGDQAGAPACQHDGALASGRLSRLSIASNRRVCELDASIAEYASVLPSGDQAGLDSDSCANAAPASFRSVPPVAAMRKTPPSLALVRANASSVPSGDHAALTAIAGERVRRVWRSDPTGFTYRSNPGRSGDSPFQAKAMRPPSGDNAGLRSSPTREVRGVTTATSGSGGGRRRQKASPAATPRKTMARVMSQGKPRCACNDSGARDSAAGSCVAVASASSVPTNR